MPLDLEQYYREPLYRNSLSIILNNVVGALFAVIFWALATRTISSADVGLATAAISAATLIMSISKIGMDSGLVRYLPGSKNKVGLFSSIMLISVIMAMVLTIIFLSGVEIWSPALQFLKSGWFIVIFILYVLITMVNSVQNTTLIALRRGDLSLVQSLFQGLRIPAIFFLASFGVIGLISSYSVAYLIMMLLGVYLLYRQGITFKPRLDIDSLKGIHRFSLGNYFTNIITTIPVTVIPIMIVNTIGAKEGAYYYIAYSIAFFLFTIPNAISMSLFVEGSHDMPLRATVVKTLKFTGVMLLPAVFIIILLGNWILLIFSKEYSIMSLDMLRLLAISSIFMAVTTIYMAIQKIRKNIRINNILAVIQSSMLIVLGYVLLSRYGLLGLGFAWLITSIVISIIVVILSITVDKWLSSGKKGTTVIA